MTAGGDTIPYNENLLHATRDEALDSQVAAGQEIRGRFFFQVHKEDLAAKLVLQGGPDGDGEPALCGGPECGEIAGRCAAGEGGCAGGRVRDLGFQI